MPKVQMPQLGESVAEGTIGKWLKKPGDHVDKYEPIVEVITDKVNAEVPSPFEGTLTQILVQEGDTVPNNTEIAVIESAGEAAQPAVDEKAQPQPTAPPQLQAPSAVRHPTAPTAPAAGGPDTIFGRTDGRPRLPPSPRPRKPPFRHPATAASAVDAYEGRMTPAVRRLAREHGVDLALIAGTGHSGRVTREDIEKFVDQQKAGTAPHGASLARRRLPHPPPAPAAPAAPRRRPCRPPPRTTCSSQPRRCARRSLPR